MKPIATWPDKDSAYLNVVEGLRQVVSELDAGNLSQEPGQAVERLASAARELPAPARRPPELAAVPDSALPIDDGLYVEREQDAQARGIANDPLAQTLVIKAPSQFGKSSLLRRYKEACLAAKKRVALVDLGDLSEQDLKSHRVFLGQFAKEVARELGLKPPPRSKLSKPELRDFIEDQILTAVSDPLVIAIDRVDRVLGHDYQTDFYAMLRSWSDKRADHPFWKKLGLALVISTSPTLLMKDPLRSPFNVGQTLQLEPFSQEECKTLNRRHPHPLTDGQVEKLWMQLHGHPYLTRLACSRRMSLDETNWVELDEGALGSHLRNLRGKLSRHPELHLLEAMKQIVHKTKAPDELTFYRLEAAGLCRRERNGDVVPANALYARYFGEHP